MRLNRWRGAPIAAGCVVVAGLLFAQHDAGGQPGSWGNGVVDAGELCDDGNILPGDCCSETCELEESRYGSERTTLCVNPENGRNLCEDGVDNDGDGRIDAEDSGCATLFALQRYAMAGTDTRNSVRVLTDSIVASASVPGFSVPGFALAGVCNTAPGTCDCPSSLGEPPIPRTDCQSYGRACDDDADCALLPYPAGPSAAATCGRFVWFRSGVVIDGVTTVLESTKFGRGFQSNRSLVNLAGFVSDGNEKDVLGGAAPWVGPGMCTGQVGLSCYGDQDCPEGELCEGRLQFDDPANVYVDRSGEDHDGWLGQCQTALNSTIPDIAAAIETLTGPKLTDVDEHPEARIRLGSKDPPLVLSYGSGTHVREIESVGIAGGNELVIQGQDDTIVVFRVAGRILVRGTIRVETNGQGQGTLTPERVLWMPLGGRGTMSITRDAVFTGTALFRARREFKTGTGCLVEGALLGRRVKTRGNSMVLHRPFTALLPTDLKITNVGDPDPVGKGVILTYTINVTNDGPSAAPGAVVRENLSPQVTLIDAVPSQGVCDPAETTSPVCYLGTIERGAAAAVVVRVLVDPDAEGQLSSTAFVGASVEEASEVDNTASATNGVSVAPPPAPPAS